MFDVDGRDKRGHDATQTWARKTARAGASLQTRGRAEAARAGPLPLSDRAGGAEVYAIGRAWRRRLLRLDRFGRPFLLLGRLRGTVSQRTHVEPPRRAVRCLQFRIVLVQLDRESFDLSVAHAVGNQTKGFRADGGPNGAHGLQPRVLVGDLLDHERSRRFGDFRGNRRKSLSVRADAAEHRKAVN